MRAHRINFVSALWLMFAAAPAVAQAVGGGLRIGTAGKGVEFGGHLTERLGVRQLVDGGSVSYDDESGIRFDGKVRFGTEFLMADWHPYASGFRFSGGLVYNSQRFANSARPEGGTINISGSKYLSTQVGELDGRAIRSRAAPYLGVGWGLAPRAGSRMYFSADLGLMYQRPSASVAGTCGSLLPASVCTQLQNDIRADESEFRDSTDDLRIYPVISVGFGLRF